ncbi:MAG: hypothetical protein KKB81_03675 [Candidatus Margulisbacteria bacterium]|nr:hypothetical protein [Candidatus Margulisiibacteriota bacterium]MBU1021694.1 hypothetical protein [Candidatus Margulisiibacteriota bacterium]MBU1729572.1 hypothetical protein [Candidatus Margulisiibacteriota bacterium]MBU1955058.1 hypothetical protein [Candidatus Margulisiibacteriota bacterium]
MTNLSIANAPENYRRYFSLADSSPSGNFNQQIDSPAEATFATEELCKTEPENCKDLVNYLESAGFQIAAAFDSGRILEYQLAMLENPETSIEKKSTALNALLADWFDVYYYSSQELELTPAFLALDIALQQRIMIAFSTYIHNFDLNAPYDENNEILFSASFSAINVYRALWNQLDTATLRPIKSKLKYTIVAAPTVGSVSPTGKSAADTFDEGYTYEYRATFTLNGIPKNATKVQVILHNWKQEMVAITGNQLTIKIWLHERNPFTQGELMFFDSNGKLVGESKPFEIRKPN